MRYSFRIDVTDDTPQVALSAFKKSTANLKGAPIPIGMLLPLVSNFSMYTNDNEADGYAIVTFDCPFTIQGVTAVGCTIVQTNLEASGNEIYSKFTAPTTVTSFGKGALYLIPITAVPNVKASLEIPVFASQNSSGNVCCNIQSDACGYFALNDTALIGVTSIAGVVTVEFNKVGFSQEQTDKIEGDRKRGQQFANVFLQS